MFCSGIVGMCKEHMGVALALKVPVFFVVTKVDICPQHVLKHTLATLQAILKKPGVKKKPFMVCCHCALMLFPRPDATNPFVMSPAHSHVASIYQHSFQAVTMPHAALQACLTNCASFHCDASGCCLFGSMYIACV